jgi:hypothetical protein
MLVRAVILLSLSEDAELQSDSSHGVHRVASPPTPALRVHSGRPKSTWRGVAKLLTCSIHVVSLDFDGLLRVVPYEFVAPRSRPWGSPSFRFALPKHRSPFPGTPHPSKLSLSSSLPLSPGLPLSPRFVPSRRCAWFPHHLPCCHFGWVVRRALDLRALLCWRVRC